MLHWLFWFEDAQEQALVQVPNHDKFFDAQTALWPALFDIASNLRAPGQLQLDDCTHPSPWGSLESYLSRRMPVRWHAAESGAEVIGSWQN